jgi:hypothetical protein
MEENDLYGGGSPRPEAEITAQETQIHLRLSWSMAHIVQISVADPDPLDPHVLGPPGSGSGSTSQRYGSGSFYHCTASHKPFCIERGLYSRTEI